MSNKMKSYAFTMLELVFVILVVGILAATMAPRFSRDSLQEASDKLISHLRYTKHLAMVDEKFDTNDANWYKERWQLLFAHNVGGTSVWAYTIFSDTSNHDGNVNIADEIATNPANPNMYLSGGYSAGVIPLTDPRRDKTMALGETYGIQNVQFNGGCNAARRIAFDYLGRPIAGNLKTSSKPYQTGRLLTTQCRIVLCANAACSEKATIAIEPQTGYIHIL